jgi:hypothetical protein
MVALFVAIFILMVVAEANEKNKLRTQGLKYTYNAKLGGPRMQWNENRGYCGEVSFIGASLSYGAYFSQYDIRAIGAKYKDNAQTTSSLLINKNDEYTASEIKLSSSEWNYYLFNSESFLLWIKKAMMQGTPVTIGVFMNHYLFYGDTSPTAGDGVYDHIVSVYSVSSNFNDSTVYHEDDVITISDHGLWYPRIQESPQYLYSYTFKNFLGTRRQANAQNGNLYTLPLAGTVGNCGIEHTGILDTDNVLLPIFLETDKNYEAPEIGYLSNTRPAPMSLTLTVTVSQGIKKGQTYMIYKYNDEKKVPTSQFNANAKNSMQQWSFVGESDGQVYSFKDTILSNEKAIYRCVPTNAP